MKIQVVSNSGEPREIDLTPPVTATQGERFNRLTDARGIDHYFRPDGSYDGWGTGQLDTAEARALIRGLEDVRAGRVRSLAEIDSEEQETP